ncbi:translation elongation factor Ts [Parvicella tangerina]|uniref:Elongation factor Ts n=1 Tax=Parvicella tangerina TaxID=2829795 RepID=A0A916NJV2_9FLAO|nr:translation elongation factor Ts [Parvicella tangerina]CAG5086584.1 Elongation factor Ts [Parvicella tangerina]
MAAITAKDVNELRKKTGAGMMDCKKALTEANGDMQEAMDLLRKKGQKIAAKRGDREASEGLVLAEANADGSKGYILSLNCETDFVAKNEDFGKLAKSFLDTAMSNNVEDKDALLALTVDGMTIADKITEQSGVIGEKLEIGDYGVVEAAKVVAYNHPGNQIASIVGLTADDVDAGRQVAMQVAAMAPVAVDENSVPQDIIEKELEIGKELAIQEGKPAEMAEKIAQGRLKKFFKETTLLNQQFIKDNKQTVKDFLKSQNADLTVTSFKRISLSV